MTKQKLVILDTPSIFHSAFYALLPREWYKGDKEEAAKKIMQTSSGVYVNAVFGAIKVILKIIHEQRPSHLACCFDVSRSTTYRRKLYPDYKGTRSATPEPLKSQFSIMENLLKAMNVPIFKEEGFEADDFLGSLAKKFEKEIPVYVVTKDHDSLQLVSNHTLVWLGTSKANDLIKEQGVDKAVYNVPYNFFEVTPHTFGQLYNLNEPKQIIDYKALTGDKSDNIPGISGIGDKSALPLLNEFQTIESLFEYVESNEERTINTFFKELGIARSPLKALKSGKEMAYLSKELATIKTDIDLNVTLDDLILSINEKEMHKAFTNLEFYSLIDSKERKEQIRQVPSTKKNTSKEIEQLSLF